MIALAMRLVVQVQLPFLYFFVQMEMLTSLLRFESHMIVHDAVKVRPFVNKQSLHILDFVMPLQLWLALH